MSKYIFNARDVAAYFKYFSVPSHLEVSYMQYIFKIGTPVLAAPLTREFEAFKGEVYRELYYLWANGFEGEKSDISYMPERGALALICDQECINLESYMKLITLHLIFTKNLPYVKLNFAGMPLSLGIRCDYAQYEENVARVVSGLNLVSKDRFGKVFDLKLGVPDELLEISLSQEFKQEILGSYDFRATLRKEEGDRMAELRAKSLKVFGTIPPRKPERKSKAAARLLTDNDDKSNSDKLVLTEIKNTAALRRKKEKINPDITNITSKNQPKGIPLEERRHKDGNK